MFKVHLSPRELAKNSSANDKFQVLNSIKTFNNTPHSNPNIYQIHENVHQNKNHHNQQDYFNIKRFPKFLKTPKMEKRYSQNSNQEERTQQKIKSMSIYTNQFVLINRFKSPPTKAKIFQKHHRNVSCYNNSYLTLQKKSKDMTNSSSAKTKTSSIKISYLEQAKLKKLSNHFLKGQLLGEGFYGKVYTGISKQNGSIYALKYISEKKLDEQKAYKLLQSQIQIQKSCQNRNIIKLFDVFYQQNYYVLVMELCTEGSLYKKMKKVFKCSQEQTAEYIYQLCCAVNSLHNNYFVHSDIKLQNILLDNGIIKLCDFGHSFNDLHTNNDQVSRGTPLYQSPQVIKQKKYTKGIDIWAIGILTYELIVGLLPFKIYGQNQLEKIITDQVKFPEYMDITNQAKDFILKSLTKNRYLRPSIDELLRHPFLTKRNEFNTQNKEFLKQFHSVLNISIDYDANA